ncbi:hypothetical protein CRUP_004418 [Coryphaenoides rupestris]|nr:hypothetical protein CRUP_004418 [Coryphaenoides rupestris]
MSPVSTDLSVCESYILELNHLLQSMEVLHRTYSVPSIQALQVPTCSSTGIVRLHASNPNLSTAVLGQDKAYPEMLSSPVDVAKLQEDFCRVAFTCE